MLQSILIVANSDWRPVAVARIIPFLFIICFLTKIAINGRYIFSPPRSEPVRAVTLMQNKNYLRPWTSGHGFCLTGSLRTHCTGTWLCLFCHQEWSDWENELTVRRLTWLFRFPAFKYMSLSQPAKNNLFIEKINIKLKSLCPRSEPMRAVTLMQKKTTLDIRP